MYSITMLHEDKTLNDGCKEVIVKKLCWLGTSFERPEDKYEIIRKVFIAYLMKKQPCQIQGI